MDECKPLAAGVTHNDIKPDNCLRSATGEFKLADLGLGVRMKAGADTRPLFSST